MVFSSGHLFAQPTNPTTLNTYGGPGEERFWDASPAPWLGADKILVLGSQSEAGSWRSRLTRVLMDTNGVMLSETALTDTTNTLTYSALATRLAAHPNGTGTTFLVGRSAIGDSAQASSQGFVMAVSTAGNVLWMKGLPNATTLSGITVSQTGDTLIVCGFSPSQNPASDALPDPYVAMLNAYDGSLITEWTPHLHGLQTAFQVVAMPGVANRWLLIGDADLESQSVHGAGDGWAAGLTLIQQGQNVNFDTLWQAYYGGPGGDGFQRATEADAAGRVLVTGEFRRPGAAGLDGWLLEIDGLTGALIRDLKFNRIDGEGAEALFGLLPRSTEAWRIGGGLVFGYSSLQAPFAPIAFGWRRLAADWSIVSSGQASNTTPDGPALAVAYGAAPTPTGAVVVGYSGENGGDYATLTLDFGSAWLGTETDVKPGLNQYQQLAAPWRDSEGCWHATKPNQGLRLIDALGREVRIGLGEVCEAGLPQGVYRAVVER